MTIKRALLALIAMMVLPSMVAAQVIQPPPPPGPPTPPITPAEGTAVIAVLAAFTDGNEEDAVTIDITCSGGTIAPTSASATIGEGQQFVLSNIPQGPPTTCTVTTSGLSGYDTDYLCFPGSGGNDAGPSQEAAESCQNILGNPATSCFFEDIRPYEGNGVTRFNVAYCGVINSPLPVDVDVTKVWEFFGADIIEVDTDVRLTLVCDAEIVGGTTWRGSDWYKTITLSGSDYFDEDGVDVGIGTAEFSVIPEWYSTSEDPDDQRFTRCYVKEDAGAQSAVDVENDCGEDFGDAEIMVAAGMGDSCTITNTVFFEGIPTLSQYGMAIMALLMLGLGFVGMRRFV